MSDFKTRLLDEKQQLDEKIGKLEPFLLTEAFTKIDLQQQILLRQQFVVMRQYSDILWQRIGLLS